MKIAKKLVALSKRHPIVASTLGETPSSAVRHRIWKKATSRAISARAQPAATKNRISSDQVLRCAKRAQQIASGRSWSTVIYWLKAAAKKANTVRYRSLIPEFATKPRRKK